MSRVAKVLVATAVLVALILGSFAFRRRQLEAAPSEADAAWQRLETFDAARRAKADFAQLATWDRMSGPDPYVLRQVPGSSRFVGLLRGADAIVVLDSSLHEIERLDAPEGPVALAVAEDGTVIVAGELSTRIARYGWRNGSLVSTGTWPLDGVRAIRDLASGPNGWIYAVEEHEGRLLAFRIERSGTSEHPGSLTQLKVGSGPIRLERIESLLVVDCLLDHALVVVKLDPGGALGAAPLLRIVHDGPIWSFAARRVGPNGNLLIAAGGVEDHPLDRTIGAFGYIDSFLYLYDVDTTRGVATREASINLSELGVVTPKTVVLETQPSVAVTVAGYATDRLVRLNFDADRARPPNVRTTDFVPGVTSVTAVADGSLVFADPLLDAWVRSSAPLADAPGSVESNVVAVSPRSPRGDIPERIGEALFFTTMMAPWNRSDGPLSRFTCETCHYEGYVDGRTHHTGRGEVHAVTKPLLGLWNNRPHFSRALDEDLTTVAFNEFRVASAKSDHDPWFTLRTTDAPWISHLGYLADSLSPEQLRKALMSFLIAFNHRPNPMVLGRTHFSDREHTGAVAFRDRCESCHEARLASDMPASRVPFDRWEGLVMAREGAIVWGKAEYQKTGILPYVHEDGARVPSLRRLYKKRPYFTNGSAKDLEAVLDQARLLPDGFQHAITRPDRGATLDEPSRAALLAFLDLL
jgi:hypothetical protein